MIETLAISNYRSLLGLTISMGRLNLITGPNGSGKSNLYRALRLLAETARDGVVSALAREGGFASTFWAGPETLTREMRSGALPIQGGPRKKPVRLQLGFAGKDFGYSIALGYPQPSNSAFALDPEIKIESIWSGPLCSLGAMLVERKNQVVRVRKERQWLDLPYSLQSFDSIFSQVGDPSESPVIVLLRERMRNWRFYDQFRTDRDAPARQATFGTRTPVLHHDGRDVAAALQTIAEIGDVAGLTAAVRDAFPGATVCSHRAAAGQFDFLQHGLLRPLSAAELSDGTLRYLLWVAALLTPRPPPLMVLNEPETSLHPDLLPPLARLIGRASETTQIWVVSHSRILIEELRRITGCCLIELEKELGETRVLGQSLLDQPAWKWPA